MKFLATSAAALALVNAAFASPLTSRAAAKGRSVRRPGPGLNHRNSTSGITHGTADEASSNWAGAVIVSSDVTYVTGTFTVPQPSPPPGGDSSTEYCGAAWAGIDGDTCQSGLIQTGVFWCVQGGSYSYEAWYEWIPQASIPFDNVNVNAGDSITVEITYTSSNSGTTTLINNSNGQSGTFTFSNESQGTLCAQNAEWIVEDFESGGSLVPFADFGTVTFTGASATIGGATQTPGGESADNLYIDQNNQQLTSTSISGDTVTVTYE